jgi:FAD/FMN-containing dehydrogenase
MSRTSWNNFTGVLIGPEDPGYERCRAVWNGLIDRRPLLIARCRTAEDVSIVIQMTAETGTPLTVRGGGHNVAGLAVNDEAVMLDLSPMRAVRLQPGERIAHAQGGCLLSDLDRSTVPHGLACPVGVVGETGLGGLALGGGYGWLSRRWGLTCDHVVAAEVVLADGTIVETSHKNLPELLWGLRGGGGNFGAVTRFTVRLRPVRDIWLQTVSCALEHAAHALGVYNEASRSFPDDMQVACAFRHARSAVELMFTTVHLDGADGRRIVEEFCSATDGQPQPGQLLRYSALQALGDGMEPPGRRYYTKSCYLKELNKEAIDVLLGAASRLPSTESVIDINHLGGAIARLPEESSAVPARDARFICSGSAGWECSRLDERAISWARSLASALELWSNRETYVNYAPMESGPARSLYGMKRYGRLSALKAMVDPDNIFRFNHNIQPDLAGETVRS